MTGLLRVSRRSVSRWRTLAWTTRWCPRARSSPRPAPGVGVEVDDKNEFRGQSVVSAVAGTSPSITVSIDTSYDNGVTDTWRSVGTFTAQTAAGSSAHKSFPGLDRWVRASWTVSGTTPSITFGVSGEIL